MDFRLDYTAIGPLSRPGRTQDLVYSAADHATLVRVAFCECRRHVPDLLEGEMRREPRHVRIGFGLKDNRAIGGQSFVRGGPEIFRAINENALETDQLGEAMIG